MPATRSHDETPTSSAEEPSTAALASSSSMMRNPVPSTVSHQPVTSLRRFQGMEARGIHDDDETPTSSSGTSTPALSSSWILPSTVSHAVTGLLRRFSTDPSHHAGKGQSPVSSPTFPTMKSASNGGGMEGVYTPPYRTASPFQPDPLYPVTLRGYSATTLPSAQLLGRALAEEIRLLVPPRLQLCDEWNLVYSLEQDGVSLGTLYKKCEDLRGLRNGFMLIVRDGEGGLFGAYLTDAPHPSPHYFGTGECFLWRASIVSSVFSHFPPPPSSDTTNMQRSTTIGSSASSSFSNSIPLSSATSSGNLAPPTPLTNSFNTGVSTPDCLRFKAFPYSGVNDYLMFCETGFLSIGGGDGHYGLWLDDTFEKGISSSCPTFGNEPLSDEGEKFNIIGVEIWSIGNS